MKTSEQIWDEFIQHLNTVQPLGKKGEVVPHTSFLGSVAAYRKVFIQSQKETKNDNET